jgi:predicted amidohydrolase
VTVFRVALAQIVAGSDPQANLDLVAKQVDRAAAAGAELVVFPEATMRRLGLPLIPIAEPVDGPWAQRLAHIADDAGLVVVAGMFTPGEGGRVRNTLRAVGRGVDAHYDKIHLFDAFGFRESDTVAAGTEPVLIMVGDVTLGLTTCYDVRFPSLYTTLADLGAQIICIAASWGAGPGKVEQWQLLTRARALDSTTFVVAAGQADPATAGVEPRGSAPTGIGYSAAISPLGEVIEELGPERGLLVTELDLDQVEPARAAIPVLANRRL